MRKLYQVIGKVVTTSKDFVDVVLYYRHLDDFKFENFSFEIYIKVTLESITPTNESIKPPV